MSWFRDSSLSRAALILLFFSEFFLRSTMPSLWEAPGHDLLRQSIPTLTPTVIPATPRPPSPPTATPILIPPPGSPQPTATPILIPPPGSPQPTATHILIPPPGSPQPTATPILVPPPGSPQPTALPPRTLRADGSRLPAFLVFTSVTDGPTSTALHEGPSTSIPTLIPATSSSSGLLSATRVSRSLWPANLALVAAVLTVLVTTVLVLRRRRL